MRKKIYKAVCLTVLLAVALTAILSAALYMTQAVSVIKADLRDQTQTLAKMLESIPEDEDYVQYLQHAYSMTDNVRVNIIEEDGKVIFDNKSAPEHLDNHNDRPEVRLARSTGAGEDSRMSETMDMKIYYYAVKLDDGNILRMSKNSSVFFRIGLHIIPEMIAVIILVGLFSLLMTKNLTKRIMKPINEIDLDNIEQSDVYTEFEPFLDNMRRWSEEKEKAEQIRREFSANVSHELRTPLTTISGYAQMINNGMAKPEDIKSFGERIEKEADRLILLINDIINLAKLDETSCIKEAEIIDLAEAAKGVIFSLQEHANRKNVKMFFGGDSAYVKGNRTQVNEMLYNIIDNAIKYNKPNGKVIVFTGNTSEGAVITVKDTGIGIPEEDTERIFERFYRVDKSHSKTVGGTGLGLSIVKHAAMVHNVKISVNSTLGKGTQISLQFPIIDIVQSK